MLDPFEIAVRALPRDKQAELLEQINGQVAVLKEQGETVRRVLGSPASQKQGSNAPPHRAAPKASKNGKRPRSADRRRALIAQIVNGEEGKQWFPVDLEARLAQEGENISRDYIRVLGRRMVAEGDIARHPSGQGFTALPKLASVNGSAQESLKEAET